MRHATSYMWMVGLCLILLLGAGPALAKGPGGGNGGGGGGGGGGETTLGNNLSLPVLWSEGFALPLRGVYGAPRFEGEAWPEGCTTGCWFLQQDADNEWQAESLDASGAPVDVTWIDWGDNLEARPWSVTSVVRVEVVLYRDLLVPMTAFNMAHLWGEGTTEMWGTDGLTYPSTQATVYSQCARLTIQRLLTDPASPDFFAAWNPVTGAWEGDAAEPTYNSAVWMGGEDATKAYSAEINIPGKVIYGYNWNVRRDGQGAGTYRLTFSLDGLNCPLPLNTFFTDGVTQILSGVTAMIPVPGPRQPTILAEEPAGGVPVILFPENLTYIDVEILPTKGGGGKKG